MARRRLFACMSLIGMMALNPGAVSGQDYPRKPIRIMVAEIGGGADFTARLIAQALVPSLGQQVIVDNRAGTVTAGRVAATASPDGYTLLLSGSNLWLQPLMRSNVPVDAVRDFSPITLVTTSPLVALVHPSVAARSVKELIALAKARPGVLNYGSGNSGSASHLGAELFKSMAGVDIVRIGYKGQGPAVNDLVAGQVQVMFTNAPVSSYVTAGRLRALAVCSAQPTMLFPDLPTVAASGLPGYESAAMAAMFAPAGTPSAIVQRLYQEIGRVLNRTDVKEKIFNIGSDIVASTPEQLTATMKSEVNRMGKVIRDAGIREE